MKGGVTQSMAWAHTWLGLVAGWMLFTVLLSGALAVAKPEIDAWTRPEQAASLAPQSVAVQRAQHYLAQEASNATWWFITPGPPGAPLTVGWAGAAGVGEASLDPATGEALAIRDSDGGEFFADLHATLHLPVWGLWLVAASGLFMLIAVVSGTVIHKRIFRDFFTFRPGASAQRAWLDGHNVAGVLALPFHLMIAYTGLVSFFWAYMPAGIEVAYGGDQVAYFQESTLRVERPEDTRPATLASLPAMARLTERSFGPEAIGLINVKNPGRADAVVTVYRATHDRVQLHGERITFDGATGRIIEPALPAGPVNVAYRTLAGLHFAQFGGGFVRSLYVALGLAGGIVVATGAVLFTIKRGDRQRPGTRAANAYQIIERLNVGMIAGPLVATGAFFWLNRLIPLETTERHHLEIQGYFLVWAGTLVHGLMRPARRGWIEQLGLLSLLSLALPLLNLATTGDWIVSYLERGDEARTAVELGFIIAGALAAGVTWRLAASTPTRPSASGRASRRGHAS